MKTWVVFLGGFILLIAWLTRTFLFERWNNQLANIRSAHANFFIYQSNNAVISAITELAPNDHWNKLWELRTKNYNSGLDHLRTALSKQLQRTLNQKINEIANEYLYNTMGEHAQMAAGVVVVQEELLNEREQIESNKRRAEIAFWALYLIGSSFVLISNLLTD